MILSRVSLPRLLKALFPVALAAFGLFMTGFIFSSDSGTVIVSNLDNGIVYSSSIGDGLLLSTRILVFAGLGLAFSFTTNMQDFIYSLEQQFRMPKHFAYGILAAFHLLPMMPYEFKKISHAFLARGQRFFPFSPKVLVPFMIKSIRWSESLAIAMESKGFSQGGSRTSLRVIQVRWFDYGFVILSVGLAVFGTFI
jgi:energy-coupling factor transporter transmembrane protein EcfT